MSAPKRETARSSSQTRAPLTGPRGSFRRALSILARRRLARLGAAAIAILLWFGVFADFFAADLPIFAVHHGETYLFPNVLEPTELVVETVEERQQGFSFAVWPVVHHGAYVETTERLQPPNRAHPFGTDAQGRDVFAQVLHGTRTVLGLALLCVALMVVLGTFAGALAGYFGGLLDVIVARLVETLTAFPAVVLVLAILALVARPSAAALVVALSLTRWTEVTRLVRAEVIRVAAQDYILAARALGASPLRILARHVFPNARAQAIVAGTFALSSTILVEASCDFLGFGLPSSAPTWGKVMAGLRDDSHAWWLFVFPGAALFVTVISQNVLGEALRDALDPHRSVSAGEARDDDDRPRPNDSSSSERESAIFQAAPRV